MTFLIGLSENGYEKTLNYDERFNQVEIEDKEQRQRWSSLSTAWLCQQVMLSHIKDFQPRDILKNNEEKYVKK